jgi:hypothetical protein
MPVNRTVVSLPLKVTATDATGVASAAGYRGRAMGDGSPVNIFVDGALSWLSLTMRGPPDSRDGGYSLITAICQKAITPNSAFNRAVCVSWFVVILI